MPTLTKQNPLTLLPPKGDTWQQINSMKVGASIKTCGSRPDLHDPRPYGEALRDASYPLLRELIDGQWTDDHQKTAIQIFKDSVLRRSYPTTLVGALAMRSHPPSHVEQVWDALSPQEQSKVSFHLLLAQGDDDFARLFKDSDF